MDIVRQQPKQAKLKKPLLLGLGIAFFSALVFAGSQIEFSAYSAQRTDLMIATVERGELNVNVRGNGTLVPRDIRWIAANVDGRVDRVLVKAGAQVKQGDLLMELSNPQLVQLAEETRWELEAFEAETKALEVSLRNQLLDQKAKVLDAKMQFESAKLRLDAEHMLLSQGKGSISQIDYKKSKLEATQFEQRMSIEKQRMSGLKENNQAQLRAKNARLNKLRKTLKRAEDKVTSLKVLASLDGVVQEMPLEPGQRLSIGGNIAKLARQDDLIAELQIPERQIRDVAIGQTAIIDTRRNKVRGKVTRIDPAVTNGSVQVDIAFDEALPQEARPDLSIDGYIEINQLDNTLFVGRPTFAQSQSTMVLYKLASDGNHANKAQVTFGVGSAGQIEVLQGLNAGDQIILSDHSAWEHLDQIAIK